MLHLRCSLFFYYLGLLFYVYDPDVPAETDADPVTAALALDNDESRDCVVGVDYGVTVDSGAVAALALGNDTAVVEIDWDATVDSDAMGVAVVVEEDTDVVVVVEDDNDVTAGIDLAALAYNDISL